MISSELDMESGNVIVLKDALFGCINAFIVEKIGSQGYTLALIEQPYQRLTLDKDSAVFKSGSVSINNLFNANQMIDINGGDSGLWNLSVSGNKKGSDSVSLRYLGVAKNGSLAFSSITSSSDISCKFTMKLLPSCVHNADYSQCFDDNVNSVCPVKQWHIRRFINEGYLQLSAIVNSLSILECVHYLNHHLGKPGAIVAGGVQTGESLGKFEGHLSNCAAVRAVFKQTERILDLLLGPGCYDSTNISGQIAFRFPELENPPLTDRNKADIASSIAWHTDGLRQGKSHGFSILLGVVLSDIESEFCGNLMVWPGSHLLLHRCKTTEQGALDEEKLALIVQQKPFSDLRAISAVRVKHVPQKSNNDNRSHNGEDQTHDNEPELPSLGCPHQITAKAGDILLLHPDLAHAGGPNYSSDIRKMIYFRIKARPAGTSWDSVVQQHNGDMWVDLPGVRNILGEDEVRHITSYFS